MTNPLQAAYYGDGALQQRVPVVDQQWLAKDTCRLRFRAPEMADRFVPGQFLMLRLADYNDPLIGRPLALYDLPPGESPDAGLIDVVYLVKGKLTRRLATFQPGQQIDVWGPLGNGFPPTPTRHLVMVAGGIGQTPFLTLGQEYLGRRRFGSPARRTPGAERVTLCYGARSAEYLAGVDDFRRAGIEVLLATDDGSRGRPGLVTALVEELLAEEGTDGVRVVCCGPEPMMEATAALAARLNVPCEVSLETPMACGLGICFTCVAKVRDPAGGWDYRRTCVEGPVFDAASIVW